MYYNVAYVSKLNGRVTEQVYQVELLCKNASAISSLDFAVPEKTVTIDPDMQEVPVPIRVLADDVMESIETFVLEVSNVANARPRFGTSCGHTKTTVSIIEGEL